MRLYTPPDGYYDLPFTWIYDGTGLVDGQDYLNQFVYLQKGYGQFVMRRIVGLDRILQLYDVGFDGGRYQIRDKDAAPLQSYPTYAYGHAYSISGLPKPDIGIVPEVVYPETGKIGFDLYNVAKQSHASTSQVAFQGVRRMQGSPPRKPGYKAHAKSFTYLQQVTLTDMLGGIKTVRTKVDDYDFELYNINLVVQKSATATMQGEGPVEAAFFANPGIGSFSIEVLNTGAANTPFSISVVGTVITVQAKIGPVGPGDNQTIYSDLLAAWNSTPAALAFASLVVYQPSFHIASLATTVLAGNLYQAIIDPFAALWIYDANKQTISSAPMLDIFCDGTPGGVYENGAIVTPLWYPKDSQIQIDWYSLIEDATLLNSVIYAHFVGKQYIPC